MRPLERDWCCLRLSSFCRLPDIRSSSRLGVAPASADVSGSPASSSSSPLYLQSQVMIVQVTCLKATKSPLQASAVYEPIRRQVRQQACKTQIPSYGLKQRRRPQFPMPTDRRRRCPPIRTRRLTTARRVLMAHPDVMPPPP